MSSNNRVETCRQMAAYIHLKSMTSDEQVDQYNKTAPADRQVAHYTEERLASALLIVRETFDSIEAIEKLDCIDPDMISAVCPVLTPQSYQSMLQEYGETSENILDPLIGTPYQIECLVTDCIRVWKKAREFVNSEDDNILACSKKIDLFKRWQKNNLANPFQVDLLLHPSKNEEDRCRNVTPNDNDVFGLWGFHLLVEEAQAHGNNMDQVSNLRNQTSPHRAEAVSELTRALYWCSDSPIELARLERMVKLGLKDRSFMATLDRVDDLERLSTYKPGMMDRYKSLLDQVVSYI